MPARQKLKTPQGKKMRSRDFSIHHLQCLVYIEKLLYIPKKHNQGDTKLAERDFS